MRIYSSAVNFPPMADGDDDLQHPVMDFINHPVITRPDPPRIASFELLHIRRMWVGFQQTNGLISGSQFHPANDPTVLNRFRQDNLKFHFALRPRFAR